jgi:hypothetical protein
MIIEKARRLAHGFRTFAHYRLRILLAADGTRPLPSNQRPCIDPKSLFTSSQTNTAAVRL